MRHKRENIALKAPGLSERMLERRTPTDVDDLFWLRNLVEVVWQKLCAYDTEDDDKNQDTESPWTLSSPKKTAARLGPWTLRLLPCERCTT